MHYIDPSNSLLIYLSFSLPFLGVFYEGVGSETYVKDGKTIHGVYVNNEWGQTGANSSMYKYFDILIGMYS